MVRKDLAVKLPLAIAVAVTLFLLASCTCYAAMSINAPAGPLTDGDNVTLTNGIDYDPGDQDPVLIEVSPDGVGDWQTIYDGAAAGPVNWTLAEGLTSDQCVLRISGSGGSLGADPAAVSGVFTIDNTDPTFADGPTADPATWTSEDSVNILWTGDALSGVDSEWVAVDPADASVLPGMPGSEYSENGSPFLILTPGLTDGEHKAYVYLESTVGLYNYQPVSFWVDRTQPNPLTISASPDWIAEGEWTHGTSTVTFSTTDPGATDVPQTGSGIKNYQVKLDVGGVYAVHASLSAVDVSGVADGAHTIYVKATDNAGNEREGTVDINVDNTPPDTFDATPDQAGWFNGDVNISFSTSDDASGVDKYDVQVDGGHVAYVPDGPGPGYTISAQGQHTVRITAMDNARPTPNTRDCNADVVVKIDKLAPTFTAGPSVDPASWTSADFVDLSWTGSAASDISDEAVAIDPADPADVPPSGTTEYAGANSVFPIPVTTSGPGGTVLSDGKHTAWVWLQSGVGLENRASVDFWIDRTQPETFDASVSTAAWTKNDVDVTFSTTDASAGVKEYYVDVDNNGSVDATIPDGVAPTFTMNVEGTHAIKVTAADNATPANTRDANAVVTTNIDKTAPVVDGMNSAAITNASAIVVNYNSHDVGLANAPNGSNVKQVTLWVKTPGGAWAATAQTSAAANGSFNYVPAAGDGVYAFGIKVEDNAGNISADPAGAGSTSTIYDTTPPSCSIAAPAYPGAQTAAKAGDTVTFRVTYADNNGVTVNLTPADVVVTPAGATVGAVTIDDANTATPTVNVPITGGDGTVTIAINGGAAVDAAGNADLGNGPSAPATVDNTAPTVTIGAPVLPVGQSAAKAADEVTYTVTFSEPVTGFDAAGVTLNAGAGVDGEVAVDAVSETQYTVTLTNCTGDGTLGIKISADAAVDAAANGNTESDDSTTFDVDNTAPTAVVSAGPVLPVGQTTVKSTDTVTYTVTFSEPVTGFAPDGIVKNNDPGVDCDVAVAAVSGTVYTVTLTNCSGDGNLGIEVDADAAMDIAGNGNTASADSATFVVDNNAPTVEITGPVLPAGQTAAKAADTVTYTVEFSEPVTGFTVADIAKDNTAGVGCNIAVAAVSGKQYTVTLTNCTGDGVLAIRVNADGAVDAAGNGNVESADSDELTVDNTAPVPTIAIRVDKGDGNGFVAIDEPILWTNRGYNYQVVWGATDTGSGVKSKQIHRLYQIAPAAAVEADITPNEPWDLSADLPAGNDWDDFQLSVAATDNAGNAAAPVFAIAPVLGGTHFGVYNLNHLGQPTMTVVSPQAKGTTYVANQTVTVKIQVSVPVFHVPGDVSRAYKANDLPYWLPSIGANCANFRPAIAAYDQQKPKLGLIGKGVPSGPLPPAAPALTLIPVTIKTPTDVARGGANGAANRTITYEWNGAMKLTRLAPKNANEIKIDPKKVYQVEAQHAWATNIAGVQPANSVIPAGETAGLVARFQAISYSRFWILGL